MKKLERLQNEMKQIESEGKAKTAEIHQEKNDALQRIDKEKAETIRENEASSRDDFNKEVTKFKEELKDQKTNIITVHKRNMDSLHKRAEARMKY